MILAKNFARNYEKNKTRNIRCLVDESFVPATQWPSILYWRLLDFYTPALSWTISSIECTIKSLLYLRFHMLSMKIECYFRFLAFFVTDCLVSTYNVWSQSSVDFFFCLDPEDQLLRYPCSEAQLRAMRGSAF